MGVKRRQDEVDTGEGKDDFDSNRDQQPLPTSGRAEQPVLTTPPSDCQACLCVFDFDRALTDRQGDISSCLRNRVTYMYGEASGGGLGTCPPWPTKHRIDILQ